MNRVWEASYKHDRRKHRHRCFVCNRILNEGEQVTMHRLPSNGKCRAMHSIHRDERHSPTYTWLEVLNEWSK